MKSFNEKHESDNASTAAAAGFETMERSCFVLSLNVNDFRSLFSLFHFELLSIRLFMLHTAKASLSREKNILRYFQLFLRKVFTLATTMPSHSIPHSSSAFIRQLAGGK
jgi:hypothetical protein